MSTKQQIIRDRQKGETLKVISKRYNLSCPAVWKIWKNRDKIMNTNFAPGTVTSHSKKRSTVTEAMEIQLVAWLKEEERKGITVGNSDICLQAKMIHTLLLEDKQAANHSPDEPPFAASSGWLYRFLGRLRKASAARGKNYKLPTHLKGTVSLDFGGPYGITFLKGAYICSRFFNHCCQH